MLIKNTILIIKKDQKYSLVVLRHPVYRDEKNICVRAPIDFVTIYKNEPNANKWIFDERG